MDAPIRIVFFGSPSFALPSLAALVEAPWAQVVLAVTQPARPRGRSGRPASTEVSAAAAAAGIPVLAPERLRRESTAEIAARAPHVGVLAASGHLLPGHLLEAFPRGVVNVHASLLPRHRGASPVAAAILAGDGESGASLMLVERRLDAGPVIASASAEIGPLDTTGTLTSRIAEVGSELLRQNLAGWVAGDIPAVPQEEARASYAPRLRREDGAVDWSLPAVEIWRRVRAYQPWPQATATRPRRGGSGEPLLIQEAWPAPLPEGAAGAPPGTVLAGSGEPLSPLLPGRRALAVAATGEGGLALLRLQRAGRRSMGVEEYLRGDPRLIGSRLGDGARASA